MVKKKIKKKPLTIKERLRTSAVRMSWYASKAEYEEMTKKNQEFADADEKYKDFFDHLQKRENREDL